MRLCTISRDWTMKISVSLSVLQYQSQCHLRRIRLREGWFRWVVHRSRYLWIGVIELLIVVGLGGTHVVRDNIGPVGGLLRLTVGQGDFTVAGLVCILQTLKEQRPDWATKRVGVAIFTDDEAASHFDPGDQYRSPDLGKYDSELRAIYSRNADGSDESLAITPVGLTGEGGYDSTIDLSPGSTFHCRLELNGRCLFSLRPIRYPKDALTAGAAGKVTLSATVRTDGTVADVKVTQVNGVPTEWANSFAEAAAANLESWRVEPATRQHSLSLTFSYVIDPLVHADKPPTNPEKALAQRLGGYTDVRFELPDQITIRGNPIR